ncbi:DUF349 domain-containing protein [Populibacterium corticicola]|uniref:DUF349 domain-containing protein n=1 Tax=Populibacterium corticicola TaxID=1812826 RepID=A0ABW5XC31_9MICO
MTENPQPQAAANDGDAEVAAEQTNVVESAAPEQSAAPTPVKPKPTAIKPAAPVAPAPVPTAAEAAAIAAASAFGRVDADGTVYVTDGGTERVVGQFPDATAEEALNLYIRRYLDLDAKIGLFETRLTTTELPIKEIDSTLKKLQEETSEPAAVGDLPLLRNRVAALEEVAKTRRAEIEQARVAAKAVALESRTAIVEAAEKIAATDPQKIQWRPAGEELRGLLEKWKEAQRSGPRLDKPVEDALWKRFSHARTTFDRERRHFFAELEKQNAAAKAAKEALVAEAEALSTSTDWGATAAAYRDLMARWKQAGRANRKDDDALWTRFRGAQDVFFAAREQANAAVDAEYAANLTIKEQLAAKAEAILPVTDIVAAKNALREIQDEWEQVGHVPRNDMNRIEGRLRAVENAIRDAEQEKWERTNPETRARAEGALAQLEAAIEGLESELAAAQSAGNDRKAKELTESIAARRAWLEQVAKAAEEARG